MLSEVNSPSVIVVGAGIVGCTVAHELARSGARVQVLETRTPGQGATRASAGILAPYIEGHADIFRDLGARSLALYDAFIDAASRPTAATTSSTNATAPSSSPSATPTSIG